MNALKNRGHTQADEHTVFFLTFQQRANCQIRELLKTPLCNEMLSQQAHSAKFQAKTAVNKRVLKKTRH